MYLDDKCFVDTCNIIFTGNNYGYYNFQQPKYMATIGGSYILPYMGLFSCWYIFINSSKIESSHLKFHESMHFLPGFLPETSI